MTKMKRVVVISDLHCGHVVGLTPPAWQYRVDEEDESYEGYRKWGIIQRDIWSAYANLVLSLGPIDVLIVNGDCIDGQGKRSGGTELITPDRKKQVDMAAKCILEACAKKKIMTFGTAYHAGNEEDWETQVAERVGAEKIGSHEWVDVNGLIFDVKHHIGSSQIPHGRHTAVAKDKLWNTIWAEHEEQPIADIVVRSHVHYFSYCGGDGWLGLTTPALQGMGSKFGARRMSGHIDWGMVSFDVTSKEKWSWKYHVERLSAQKALALKI